MGVSKIEHLTVKAREFGNERISPNLLLFARVYIFPAAAAEDSISTAAAGCSSPRRGPTPYRSLRGRARSSSTFGEGTFRGWPSRAALPRSRKARKWREGAARRGIPSGAGRDWRGGRQRPSRNGGNWPGATSFAKLWPVITGIALRLHRVGTKRRKCPLVSAYN